MSSYDIQRKYKFLEMINDGKKDILIYKAINKETGEYVAIKEINKEKYKQLKNKNYEKQLIQKIQSENSEYLSTSKNFYIIMDLYSCNLDEYIKMRKDNLSIEEIREILIQLNESLKLMNNNKIIHPDLKPQNILINLEKINKCVIKLCGDDSSIFCPNDTDVYEYKTVFIPHNKKKFDENEIQENNDIFDLGNLIYYMLFKEYIINNPDNFNINQQPTKQKVKKIKDKNLNDLVNKMLNENERISWDDYFNHPFFNQSNNLFNFKCKLHNNNDIKYYCINCKNNICDNCLIEHKSHKIIPFDNIGLNELEIKEMEKAIEKIENNFNKLNEIKGSIKRLLNKMKIIKENINIYDNDDKNNYKKYYINYLNKLSKEIEIEEEINIIKLRKKEILCEYNIKEEELKNKIQILNCFDEVKKENLNIIGKDNEKEIKKNCEIYLNEEKINFNFKYNFEKGNVNKIKIKCINPIINMNYMFYNCLNLISLNLSNFNTNDVINMNNMFFNCIALKDLNLSDLNNNKVKDMNSMFFNCYSLISLNLSNFNTNNVEDMNYMFFNCSSLISLNLSNFNTNNVKNMKGMFSDCSSLNNLNLSNFNTNNVKDMSEMFFNCSSLNNLNLSNFNTNNVEDMSFMFFNCSSLNNLNLSNFNINNVEDMNYMFSHCSSLKYLNLSNFNINNGCEINFIFLKMNKQCYINTKDESLRFILNQ